MTRIKVQCDCGEVFNTKASQVTTCPSCKSSIRISTHKLQETTPKIQKTTSKIQHSFEEAKIEVPASWIKYFAVWGLKFLSAYKGKMTEGAPSSVFYDHTQKIVDALISYNMVDVKKTIDKINNLKFKLSILNIGGK